MDALRETPARDCTYLALDFETTGHVAGFQNLPWQLGAVTLVRGTLSLEAPRFDTFLGVPLAHPFARHTPGQHRANREAIAEAPPFYEVWPALHARLAAAIPTAHNISTERTLLRRFAPMTNYPMWVDTLPLARHAYPGLGAYSLEALIPRLGLQERLLQLVPGRAPHDAFYDAVACALLLEHLLSLPGWGELPIGALAALAPR